MQTLSDYSLNKHLKENVNGKIIECGIGIDYGKILVTKIGMYGMENDTEKENEITYYSYLLNILLLKQIYRKSKMRYKHFFLCFTMIFQISTVD